MLKFVTWQYMRKFTVIFDWQNLKPSDFNLRPPTDTFPGRHNELVPQYSSLYGFPLSVCIPPSSQWLFLVMYWILWERKVTFSFPWSKSKGLGPSPPEVLPFKETQFSLKKADWSTTFSRCFSFSLRFSSRHVSTELFPRTPDKGRLHESVTQEIPTLYFLSDKEPVTGDEFVATGGFDRLQGNNKAISVCQKSQRKERQKEEGGGEKNPHMWKI